MTPATVRPGERLRLVDLDPGLAAIVVGSRADASPGIADAVLAVGDSVWIGVPERAP